MSLATALYSGVSGLNSNGISMNVIGNNISNVNTIGFKSSRANFSDFVSQSIQASQIGRGSQISSITNTFVQGSMESTASVTDMAIEGDGFFVVSDGTSNYYSRAGQFIFDKNKNLVNADGYKVQGWVADSNGNATGTVQDINFSSSSTVPIATTEVTINANLNANDSTKSAFSLSDTTGTSNFSSGVTVYDSLGNEHAVQLYFTKTANSTWSWNAVVNGDDLTSGSTEIEASGVLTFNADGKLLTESTTTTDFDFKNGASQSQSIAFDFGDSITTDSGAGLLGTTQFGAPSSITLISQDGYTSGVLQSIEVNDNGLVSGFFTNGKTNPLAVLSVANFQNPNGLQSIGRNLFNETFDSGQPVVGEAGQGGSGNLLSYSLEQSNVDLAKEFVKMITTQRAFQANSRTITTTDEMMTEAINIKR